MLVFNLLHMAHLHTDDRRRVHWTDWFRRQAASQLEPIRSGRPASPRHLQILRRRLARVSHLLTFDRLLDELDGRDPAVRLYIQQFEPVCLDLARVYLRRENTQAAYFCHFLYRHQLQRFMPVEQIQQLLLSYLQKDKMCIRDRGHPVQRRELCRQLPHSVRRSGSDQSDFAVGFAYLRHPFRAGRGGQKL